MKKSIAIVLAVLSILTVLTSCNRRDQYRDPIGTSTSAWETITEASTDKSPGTSIQLTEGTPYEGMSSEALLTAYREASDYKKLSTDIVANTPYYYIFNKATFGNGGQAYSKLTGNTVTLCKDLTCDHRSDTCLFYGQIDECVLLNDRIYMLMTMFDGNYRLYSFNLMLDDVKQAYEWKESESPDRLSIYNGRFYMMGNIVTEDESIKQSLFVFDPQNNTYTAALVNGLTFQSGWIMENILYYTASDGTLWQYDIDTTEQKCLLDASLLNPEVGDVRFIVLGKAGTSHLCVMRQSVIKSATLYYDLNTGEIVSQESFMSEEIGAMKAWTQTGQYFVLKHNTPDHEKDPHYAYYNDKVENWLTNDSGGEIWYRTSTDGELTLLALMTTDRIPDAIRSIVATDGRTIVVQYSTYEDFPNVYNDYQKITGNNLETRYAIIDLETGIIYKNSMVY